MAKDSKFEVNGEVIEILPAGIIKVLLIDYGTEVRCKKSGKMSKFNVSVIPGDWVKVELSPYDPTQGRITYRHNKKPEPEGLNTEQDETTV